MYLLSEIQKEYFGIESPCIPNKRKAEFLLRVAQYFLQAGGPEEYQRKPVVREELAAGADSYLHRGTYCPSPVIDLLVGNYHRGRILKRPSSRSRISHRYLFDDKGLYMVLRYSAKNPNYVGAVEYLLHEGGLVVGITLSDHGEICMLSEERYDGETLTDYFCVACRNCGKEYAFVRGERESYIYDEEGILECTSSHFESGYYETIHRYRFIREDGCLKSYFNVKNPAVIYTPGKKRLALSPYFQV